MIVKRYSRRETREAPRGALTPAGNPKGTSPNSALDRDDVFGIDLDRRALADEADGNNQARPSLLADQDPSDSLEWAAPDLNSHSRLQGGVRVHWERTGHKAPDRLDFVIRDWYGSAVRAKHLNDAMRCQHPQSLLPREPREAIPGKERPLHLHRAIFPSAPPANQWKEYFDRPALKLGPHPFFVTGARAECIPAGWGV